MEYFFLIVYYLEPHMILYLQAPMNYSCSCSTKIFDQGSLPKPQLLIEEV